MKEMTMNSPSYSRTARRFLLTITLVVSMTAQARAEPLPDACCTASAQPHSIVSPGLGTLGAMVEWLRLIWR